MINGSHFRDVLTPVLVNTLGVSRSKHFIETSFSFSTKIVSCIEVYSNKYDIVEFFNTLEFKGPPVGLSRRIRLANCHYCVRKDGITSDFPVTIEHTGISRKIET